RPVVVRSGPARGTRPARSACRIVPPALRWIARIMRIDAGSRPSSPVPRDRGDRGPGRDGSRRLRRLAEAALGLYCLGLLAAWIPAYLTWPWWPDVDDFAALARAWDAGIQPYRDIRCINFPGPIYVNWLLGRAAGWGWSLPFQAWDAALVVGLGALLAAWGRRTSGRWLPGLAGYASFLTWY